MWRALAERDAPPAVAGHAETVATFIRQHGASFFPDIVAGTGLLRSQVEDALAELAALGMVSSDSFGGLRALLVPSAERTPFAGARRRGRTAAYGMDDAGRWAIVPPAPANGGSEDGGHIEHVARTLLRRYGVVLWRLLEREAARLPPWRDLLRVYRTLESRGEIRGGRFVAGIPGRAVRPARGRRPAARDAAQAAGAAASCRSPPPIRSTWSASSRRARASPRSPATAYCLRTDCRWLFWPAARCRS